MRRIGSTPVPPVLLTILLLIGAATRAFPGLHDSAALICSECHTIHDSEGGADVGDSGPHGYLLRQAGDALCFSCHDESLAQSPYDTGITPKVKNAATDLAGGDFALTEAETGSNTGNGHNLGSALVPAGGSGSITLACVSCHDPHGNGNYRNINTTVNSATGISVAGIEDIDWERTNGVFDHNVYQSGMAAFCGACHESFHGTSNTGSSSPFIRHPQDVDLTGVPGSASLIGTYDPLVPVENALASSPATMVSQTDSEVFCLSCHRAHASEYYDSGRWDFSVASGSDSRCNACHDK